MRRNNHPSSALFALPWFALRLLRRDRWPIMGGAGQLSCSVSCSRNPVRRALSRWLVRAGAPPTGAGDARCRSRRPV